MKNETIISLVNGLLLCLLVLSEHFNLISFNLFLSYPWHNTLHILGVAMFMVNMMVGPVWFYYGYFSAKTELIKFCDLLLRKTDVIFTVLGLDLAVINGLFLSSSFGGTSSQPWLTQSVWLMILMWILSLPLIYIQEKIYKAVDELPESGSDLKKWLYLWSGWGMVVMLPPSLVFYLMVFKNV